MIACRGATARASRPIARIGSRYGATTWSVGRIQEAAVRSTPLCRRVEAARALSVAGVSDDRIRCRVFGPGEGLVLPPTHPIYRQRVDARISQREAALTFGVPPQHPNDVEQGRVVNEVLARHAAAYYAKRSTREPQVGNAKRSIPSELDAGDHRHELNQAPQHERGSYDDNQDEDQNAKPGRKLFHTEKAYATVVVDASVELRAEETVR